MYEKGKPTSKRKTRRVAKKKIRRNINNSLDIPSNINGKMLAYRWGAGVVKNVFGKEKLKDYY